MPKSKFPKELKEQALAEYSVCKDARAVGAKFGISPKTICQWQAVQNAAPQKAAESEFKRIKKENFKLLQENALLREIVKKTALVMPID